MTIYNCTPEPDERITTVWTKDPDTGKWISWGRHEHRRWLESAGGHYYTWAELLHQGPVTDIDPALTSLADQIMDAGCGRDEVTAYRIAAVLWANGWRKSKDDPAAEPC